MTVDPASVRVADMEACMCRETDQPPKDDLILIYNPQGKLQWWGRKSCPEHGISVTDGPPTDPNAVDATPVTPVTE